MFLTLSHVAHTDARPHFAGSSRPLSVMRSEAKHLVIGRDGRPFSSCARILRFAQDDKTETPR